MLCPRLDKWSRVYLDREGEHLVRFHAMQSIVTFGALTIVSIIISFIPFIGWILGWLISILGLILWIMLMIKAYQGQRYKLPWAGDFAEKWV